MIILNNTILEFIEEGHYYICDGIIVPSITQMLKMKFGNKYDFVNPTVLKESAIRGTMIHKAIEDYCNGKDSIFTEVRNFKFLQKQYGFEVLENEIPVILYKDDKPIGAGRIDLVLKEGDKMVGADIKTTSALDKNYLFYQLNLYRIAYKQTYGKEWEALKGIHLKGDKRKYIDIPINEDMTWEFINEYLERNQE